MKIPAFALVLLERVKSIGIVGWVAGNGGFAIDIGDQLIRWCPSKALDKICQCPSPNLCRKATHECSGFVIRIVSASSIISDVWGLITLID
jgi:hypothetical protein